jgi:hypothetical protein
MHFPHSLWGPPLTSLPGLPLLLTFRWDLIRGDLRAETGEKVTTLAPSLLPDHIRTEAFSCMTGLALPFCGFSSAVTALAGLQLHCPLQTRSTDTILLLLSGSQPSAHFHSKSFFAKILYTDCFDFSLLCKNVTEMKQRAII